MNKIALAFTVFIVVFLGVAAIVRVAQSQGPGEPTIPGEFGKQTQGDNVREVTTLSEGSAPSAPDISFIDSPSVICYQPVPRQDTCYINWYYLYVTATPEYMIAMTVTINTFGTVARINGFFQTYMNVPYNMFGDGFRVACGPAGASGAPTLGNAYNWTINARDSSNLKSANYGVAYCPAFIP